MPRTCGDLQKQLEQHSARNKHLEEQLTRSKQQVAQEQVGFRPLSLQCGSACRPPVTVLQYL